LLPKGSKNSKQKALQSMFKGYELHGKKTYEQTYERKDSPMNTFIGHFNIIIHNPYSYDYTHAITIEKNGVYS